MAWTVICPKCYVQQAGKISGGIDQNTAMVLGLFFMRYQYGGICDYWPCSHYRDKSVPQVLSGSLTVALDLHKRGFLTRNEFIAESMREITRT